MKIYTKTGDKGETSLLGGERVPKNHIRIETLGLIDELNSWLGVLIAFRNNNDETQNILFQIQNNLIQIAAIIAQSDSNNKNKSEIFFPPTAVLESEIDKLEAALPKLSHLILPGGSKVAAFFHVVRTLTRKLERQLSTLDHEANVEVEIKEYINRLSDYFFVAARLENNIQNIKEKKWKKP